MIKINLLPPEKRKKLKKVAPAKKKAVAAPAMPKIKLQLKTDLLAVFPIAAAIIAMVLIGGSYYLLGHKEKSLTDRRKSMQVELNRLNQDLLDRVNGRRRVYLTGTMLGGKFTIRICVLSFRTHMDRMAMGLEDIRESVGQLVGTVKDGERR